MWICKEGNVRLWYVFFSLSLSLSLSFLLLLLSLSHNFISSTSCAATVKKTERDQKLSELRSELAIVSQEKINTERKLNEMEQSLQLCQRQSSQGGGNQVVKQVRRVWVKGWRDSYHMAYWSYILGYLQTMIE